MNTDTGHLVRDINEVPDGGKDLYEGIPESLSLAAELELMGKKEVYVGKSSTGSVNKWAEKRRAKLAKKMKQRRMNKLCCR